jgi:uncharacterized damage-inducible protein DinB
MARLPEHYALLEELLLHQEWADSEIWGAIENHPPAAQDAILRDRLYHIHVAQQAFLLIARGDPLEFPKPEDFSDLAALKAHARRIHQEWVKFMASVTPERLGALLVIPWFKEPPIEVTTAQLLTQSAMHSQGHRAQNSVRLREVGGDPPVTDLIAWYWKGRPAPRWE